MFVVFVFVAVVGVMGVGMGDFGGTVEPAHFEDGTWGSLSLSFKKAYVVAILVFKRGVLRSRAVHKAIWWARVERKVVGMQWA